MNRNRIEKSGILSPPGPFLTPSPSPSVPASSPRLHPSPSQSPFLPVSAADVLTFVGSSSVSTNFTHQISCSNSSGNTTTQDTERRTGTPNRRPSLTQTTSPNAGTVIYRPSPTQSPAHIPGQIVNVTSPAGHEFNTTLVGSNNISLNKSKGNKRNNSNHGVNAGHHGALSTQSGSSPKATKKTNLPTVIGSPTSMRPPTPQPVLQQFPVMSTSNQVLQIIQGPQLIHQQRPLLANQAGIQHGSSQQQQQQIIASSTTTTTTLKQNKVPQQILPKPAAGSGAAVAQNIIQQTTTTKTVVTQAKTTVPVQPQQIAQPAQMSQFAQNNQQVAQAAASQGGPILLPTHHHNASLNAQPLLLNQMPVIVQQNTPQGVQLILRPQTPQIAAPSLVIHNSRPPQLQTQPQPQQLLRILNTNGAMQLAAAAPTFIVSSQANLIQQNLQTIKTNAGHHFQRQPQQLTAAINSQLLGQSMAHLQNLQLNGNLTQIQMPNGLNGQFISHQLPSQFQQNIAAAAAAGFNAAQSLNLNQLTNQNLSQIAAAAAAAQTFQSPPPQEATILPMVQQFAQPTSGNVTPIACTTPQPQHIISSPSPHHQIQFSESSPPQQITFSQNHHHQHPMLVSSDNKVHSLQPQLISQPQILSPPPQMVIEPEVPAQKPIMVKKPKRTRTKKNTVAPPIVPVAPTVVVSPPQSPPQHQSTGKLDLANMIKECGIDASDYMDDVDEEMQIDGMQQNNGTPMSDIMITVPSSEHNEGIPITFSIPTSDGEYIQGDGKSDPSFMITIDPSASGDAQPYTISVPSKHEGSDEMHQSKETIHHVPTTTKQQCTVAPTLIASVPPSISSTMCVPTFVNSVLNTTVTPTLQSQINEIQNQLMAAAAPPPPTPVTPTAATAAQPNNNNVFSPKAKKRNVGRKNDKKLGGTQKDKSDEIPAASVAPIMNTSLPNVPTQIGNIHISQVDASAKHNHINNKSINNQIQIMPILSLDSKPAAATTTTTTTATETKTTPSSTPMTVMTSPQVVTTGNLLTNMQHHQPQIQLPQQMQAGNMLQTNAIPANMIAATQNPNAQALLSQLTGHLSLSFSEDKRLLLKHDVNTPQDSQGQLILQLILSGVLGNVTLVNEPSAKPAPAKPVPQMVASVQPQGHLMPGQIITSTAQNTVGHVMPQPQLYPMLQQQPKDLQAKLQADAAMMLSQNIPKIVELPKVGPNQQLFSLNTINNQITQLDPGQTTAALGPMERLLIVPSGISPQQLAQCLMQGQIHFNTIGQVAPATDPSKIQQHQQQVIQKQQTAMQPVPPQKQTSKESKKEDAKQKRKSKKLKQIEELKDDNGKQQQQQQQQSKTNHVLDEKTNNKIQVKPQLVSQPRAPFNSLQTTNSLRKNVPPNTAIVTPNTSQISPQIPCNTTNASDPSPNKQPKLVNAVPPIINLNQTPPHQHRLIVQLTPQKQQALKNVQQQIQQLSVKLQNKDLLKTIKSEYEPSNPLHNKPLPNLANVHTDAEIFEALQILFIEQQKILATGKLIPNLPPQAFAAATTPTPTMSPIAPTSNNVAAAIFSGGGQLQTIPSPIQINSPQVAVKQEIPSTTCSPQSTSPSVVKVTSPQVTGASIGNSTSRVEMRPPSPPPVDVKPVVELQKVPPQLVVAPPQPAVVPVKLPSPKICVPRPHLFEQQIDVDQRGCTNPDTKRPFQSHKDSVTRLIRYHCMYENTVDEPDDPSLIDDFEFERRAIEFQDTYESMLRKYQSLLMKESTKHVQTAEVMMIDRLLVSDIKEEITQMQYEISSAYAPPIPPPPQLITTPTGFIPSPAACMQELKVDSSPGIASPSLRSPHFMSASPRSRFHLLVKTPTMSPHLHSPRTSLASSPKSVPPPSPSPKSSVSSTSNSLPSCMHSYPLKKDEMRRRAKKTPTPPKKVEEDFDIESELTPNFIMKNNAHQDEEDELDSEDEDEAAEEMMDDYFNPEETVEKENNEPYDEWLCIQKALEEHNTRPLGHHLDSRKVGIYHGEEVKEFNDIFSNQSNHAAPSPLSELFNAGEVAPKPPMIFEEPKSDIVESRLEALFEGTNTESEDALDNASFLHKNPEISYEMVQAMSTTKRQWPGNCDMMDNEANTSTFKRQCLPGTGYVDNSDNSRWMMDCQQDSFEFESISSCESSSQPSATQEKRIWNGEILTETPDKHMLPTHMLPNGPAPGYDHHTVNFDEDISQQVQNAIDSILNLQGMDSDLTFDPSLGSFLSDPIRPPSAKRPMHHPLHNHVVHHQDIGGCLIGGGSSSGNGSQNLDDDSPTMASGANTPISQDAFGNTSTGLDDTVKSIMTS